jgi:hypothetical protein
MRNFVPEKGGQSAPSVQGGEIDWLEDAGYILNSETTGQKLAAFSWIEEGMRSVFGFAILVFSDQRRLHQCPPIDREH